MEKDFIDEFISSKDTRAYLHSIHHEFTDLEKATIVANHIMISYEKKVKWLEQFMDEITDNSLRNRILRLYHRLGKTSNITMREILHQEIYRTVNRCLNSYLYHIISGMVTL